VNRLTRLTSRAIAACLPLVMLLASAATLGAQGAGAQRVLGRDDITLYGLGL